MAVGNAVDSLRRRANLVLDGRDCSGVADLLAGPVLGGTKRIHPARWRIVLGSDAAGRPAALPAAQTNLLTIGETGKSYLTGLIIEQLVALGYVLLAAALVATTEHDLLAHGDAERTRRLLGELIAFRQLPPDQPSALTGEAGRHPRRGPSALWPPTPTFDADR